MLGAGQGQQPEGHDGKGGGEGYREKTSLKAHLFEHLVMMLFGKDMGPSGGGASLEEVGQGWVLSFYILLHILSTLCFRTAHGVGQHFMLSACASPTMVVYSPSGSVRQKKPFSWKLLLLGCFNCNSGHRKTNKETK